MNDDDNALDEAVRDAAAQIGADMINSGDQVDFLLSHGWTREEVQALTL